MKRIIIHWTAGLYYPSDHEKKCYHFLVDKDGNIHKGVFKPENNLRCINGYYAAHTGGGNTSSIGVAMCAMAGFKNSKNCGDYPITKKQFEACMELCAKLSINYDIPVNPNTILTHYEFGMKHPSTSSAGKIDIIFIPPYPWVDRLDAGKFIRAKIKWYKEKLQGE